MALTQGRTGPPVYTDADEGPARPPGYTAVDEDDAAIVVCTDSGNCIIMDIANNDGDDVVRSSGKLTNYVEKRKTHSFMEKLMGVKNSQCELYLTRVHRELDNNKTKQVRTIRDQAIKIEYDFKLMQVDLKKSEIAKKKQTDPRTDTSMEEMLVEKSVKYLQCNNVNPCYLERAPRIPLRRTIKSDYVSPTVQQARRALQDQSIEKQVEKANEERKSVASRKGEATPSRRNVHFKTEAVDDDRTSVYTNDRSEHQSHVSLAHTPGVPSNQISQQHIIEKEHNGKSKKQTFSSKATVVSYSSSSPLRRSGSARISQRSSRSPDRPITARIKPGDNAYKILLSSEQSASVKEVHKDTLIPPEVKVVDRTDIQQWADESARYHSVMQPGRFPSLTTKSSGRGDEATPKEDSKRPQDNTESAAVKDSFMKTITSWNAHSRSSTRSGVSSAKRSVSSAKKPPITFEALMQEQQRLGYRIKTFCRQLANDKAREEEEAMLRERELRDRAALSRAGDVCDVDDEAELARALSASRTLNATNSLANDDRSAANPTKSENKTPSKAKRRWQNAIRHVIDNLDQLIEAQERERASREPKRYYQGQIDVASHRAENATAFSGFGCKSRRGVGVPSNSLLRSKRHTATFQLRKVVEQLLKNKSTFQRLQYEDTKKKMTEVKA